ncbi:hypothetical protein MKY96_33200 [Paenibacillus sp. FSL R7-0302]|uniref:hypothetical protein n=1 Tax=Paenibacillus sp. FSL R7-0302 TaxID=2921681 RepID=UPI0030F4EA2C
MAKRILKARKVCTKCRTEREITENFYSSSSSMFPDGRVTICKACIQEELDVTNNDSVKRVLRQIDRPFLATEWQKSLDSGREPLGWYLRKISALHQYKNLTYEDSVDGEVDLLKFKDDNDFDITEEDIYDKATPDIRRKWGTGYSDKEYYELEITWKEMIDANAITTPQHKTNLELYCQLKVKIKRALEKDDFKTFEALNKQFADVQKNSGFRPIDKISGSESSGIRNFSTIFEEVERDGFIEPYSMVYEQDIIDKTILYLNNYTRKLMNMGQLSEPPEDTPKVGE